MKKLILKITGYIFLRYITSFILLLLIDKSAKFLKLEDVQTREDWFMFFWLFLIPVLLEWIIFVVPLSYGLNKITKDNRFWFSILLLVLFLIEYLIANYVFGFKHSYWKVAISIVLFMLLFKSKIIERSS